MAAANPTKEVEQVDYKLDDLDWVPLGHGWERAAVLLERGDTASNPASTKEENVLRGPASVTYDRHRSGIHVIVEDHPTAK